MHIQIFKSKQLFSEKKVSLILCQRLHDLDFDSLSVSDTRLCVSVLSKFMPSTLKILLEMWNGMDRK